jgi:hypothetical protein
MSAEDAYTPFNDELEEIINATSERASAVAEIRAEMDTAARASSEAAGRTRPRLGSTHGP